MTVQFRLPDLGEGITEVEIVRWHVKPGDTVVEDQAVVSVQSDKAVVELPAPVSGTVVELNVSEGQIVPVETVLFTLQSSEQNAVDGIHHVQQPIASRNHVLATPVARRMAREFSIDISEIKGSGPAGRVRTEDVQKRIAAMTTSPQILQPPIPIKPTIVQDVVKQEAEISEEEHIPVRGLRRRIAENMLYSVQTIPQVTSQIEVDASELVALRKAVLEDTETQGLKLSYLPFIIKALIQALRLYPYVNATFDAERKEIVLKRVYHIGIATATPDGLLVPVLRNADRLTMLEIATEVNRLAEAARVRTLQPHDLRGSTFTISNYGSIGGFFTTPLINPGEAGILGLGRIIKRPWVVDDQIEVRPVLPLSFTADHRLIDGELAMHFLNTLVSLLEHPQRLLLNMR
jgi:pyruvate dehydrogenase E2 component (dihydrolipoamide acetyltransferase)